jgi:hypothetical protein
MKIAGNDSSPVYVKELAITGGPSTTGVWTALANPAGVELMILRAYLRITTASTGASTLDIGIGATSTTASDVLLDGISGASTGVFDSMDGTDNGTNGVAKPQVWGSTAYVTVKEASGDVDGLVATLYVEYTYT